MKFIYLLCFFFQPVNCLWCSYMSRVLRLKILILVIIVITGLFFTNLRAQYFGKESNFVETVLSLKVGCYSPWMKTWRKRCEKVKFRFWVARNEIYRGRVWSRWAIIEANAVRRANPFLIRCLICCITTQPVLIIEMHRILLIMTTIMHCL